MKSDEDYKKADVYVLSDIRAMGGDLLWAAFLAGKHVADKEFIVSRGEQGACLKFKGAVLIARAMHFTPRFALRHEEKARLLLHHSTVRPGSGSKWKYVQDERAFLDLAAKAVKQSKPTLAIAFMEPEDEPRFQHVKMRYSTVAEAVDALCVLDRQCSATGMTTADARWA
jgi:hypothetical protein